jgi:hypothetical protein
MWITLRILARFLFCVSLRLSGGVRTPVHASTRATRSAAFIFDFGGNPIHTGYCGSSARGWLRQ